MSARSDAIRIDFKKGDDERDKGLTTPDDIIRYDDIKYGEAPLQVLDVYRPKNLEGKKLPVLVNIHGGGWVYGTKEVYQFYCMSLSQRGFAVVNFSYRLAPEDKYPACMEDVESVFNWIVANKEKYDFDIDNVFAMGDSAGGHIASLYAALLTDKEAKDKYGYKLPSSICPKALLLNCGKYEMSYDDADNELMEDLLGKEDIENKVKSINVLNFITPNFPPSFIMTGTADFLKDQAVVLAKSFVENNVPFQFHMYGDNVNKLWHVFHCNMRLDAATVCNDEEIAFIRKYIK